MSVRKFEKNDIFINVLKTSPSCKFSIYNGKILYKKEFANSVPDGNTAINDLNLLLPEQEVCSNSFNFSEECNSQYIPLV
jgi:hypothetical protein